ncbi:hypothetical protein CYLTODRAFT_350042 [Cylindrobasidium torrendii FP15055 ss-10]|uniref:Uncharacterized protein n=1 Tax=Cylindrobasidium torrendii FP15055 ss-10 TaxID=1314674 RepID=A0A0D7BG24_9AGAR|nr:hypothetical protein CYLTODRAFT_350042 [Cylindrobasidium torrendii FP15055 ss-10]
MLIWQVEDGAEVSAKDAKRKRATSGTPRTRKKRTPSLPPYDPTADPGEQIDPTIVTMASLCEDTGFGRVSSKAMEIQKNHVQWKQANRQRMADMRAKSERKKYGLKDSDDEGETTKKEPQSAGGLTSVDKDAEGVVEEEEPGVVDETGQGFDYSQRLVANRYNAQVRIGPNGETIIDEQSLTIDRDENDATEHYTQITESDTSKFTNSSTYTKRLRGSRWSGEETELFYDALMQYGENYELISMILPGRDRKACKNKFKAEDKRNPTRITFALKNKKPIDMEVLSRLTGKDFSGPVPEIAAPPPPNAAPPGESDEALHQIKTSSSRPTTPAPQKKRSRKQTDVGDGVEIMGTVDDFMDEDEVLVELDKR